MIDFTTFTWQNFTPTFTGFSTPPSGGIYRYYKYGKMVTVSITQPNNGTSNANTFTMSLPLVSANNAGQKWNGLYPQPVNGGTVLVSGPGVMEVAANSSTLQFYPNLQGDGWVTSGGKRVPAMVFTYECA